MDLFESLIGLAGVCVAAFVGCIILTLALLADLACRRAWPLLVAAAVWRVLR